MSPKRIATTSRIELGDVTPVLRVSNASASVDYYTRVLGFKINFQFPDQEPFFASVSRGRCCLFLSEGDQGNPGSWVWIDGKNVEALHEEFRAAGAKIRHPPTNYSWALEMQVEDPDGNVLRFGSDPKKDELEGEWLDMYGNRWLNGKRVETA
jgi:catechol 2,3-dioxygenase-like lactoylglutathione lyase family enzyme